MILDTTFIIDVLSGDSAAEQRRIDLDEQGAGSVSAVTVFELIEGAYLFNRTDDELETILEFLSRLRVIPFDGDVGMLAGELSAGLITRGERIETEDVIIAATALNTDQPVLPRNVEHFDRIPDLVVESY